MVEVANRSAEAAWKIRNLEDYDSRLERAVVAVDHLFGEDREASLVVYEAALMKSGHPRDEVREMVARFRETFEVEDEPLTISRTSGLMNVEGDEWFFGDGGLRVLTGRLLGQFQHRVAQYNYLDELEVLRRWADGYDTRLFVRRRIHDTEPVVGVVGGFDLRLMQYLRVVAGGDTLVPSENVVRALEALGYDSGADDYDTLARAEGLALHLELPAPLVGEILEEIGKEGLSEFPEPPREAEPQGEDAEDPESPSDENAEQGVAATGGGVNGGAAAEAREEKPSPEDRAAREAAREDPGKGEEPSRVQDPQASDAPGVREEAGTKKEPAAPEDVGKERPKNTGREGEE